MSVKQQEQSQEFLRSGPKVFTDNLSTMNAANNTSFDDVEPEAMLFAKIIRQARMDSMPEVIFDKNSKEPLFSSEVPDAYDGFDFMSSNRMDLYANMINQDPDHYRRDWKREYNVWKATTGIQVALNIFDHTVRLLLINPDKNANHLDASSFLNSPQFKYWCKIANVSSSMQKEKILKAVEAKQFLFNPSQVKAAAAAR